MKMIFVIKKHITIFLLCMLFMTTRAQEVFYIESRDETGAVTRSSLYEEFGDWYAPGSSAKSNAPASGLPENLLRGQGSRFSFNSTLDASCHFKISAHEKFEPGKAYDIYITTPNAPSIDALNSTFILFDDDHPEDSPLAAGNVPLDYIHCGDQWYKIAENVKPGNGATLKISESAPQGDRFYADAVMIRPYYGDSDRSSMFSLGRKADLSNPDNWILWSPTLENPSTGATVQKAVSGIEFDIPESGAEMRWRQSLRPAWMDFHRYLVITYKSSGLDNETPFTLLNLCYSANSWKPVFSSTDIISDRNRHTKIIDLQSITSVEQIIGAEIYLRSAGNSEASFKLEDLSFHDYLPGFPLPPPPEPEPVTDCFTLGIEDATTWVAKPDWLGPENYSSDYAAYSSGSSLIFSVDDASRGMKWLYAFSTPCNTESHPYVILKYRCRNIYDSISGYAMWLSGTGGESRPLYLADLADDGHWRWAFAPLEISHVQNMAMQVQSTPAGNAFLEIGEMRFVDGDPRSDLSWFSSIETGWDDLTSGTAIFQQLDISGKFNSEANQLLPRMGIDVPWFMKEKVSCANLVPFKVTTDSLNLISTTIPGTTSIDIPVYFRASEIYLFLGTYYPGREHPYHARIITVIDETERLMVEVIYADQSSERFFPVDIASGTHKISNNSFTALAVPANPSKKIEKIRIHEKSDGGLIALAAVSLNTSDERFFGENFIIPAPVNYKVADNPVYFNPAASYNPPYLVMINSLGHYRFDLSKGISLGGMINHFNDLNILKEPVPFISGKVNGENFTSKDFILSSVDVNSGDGISTAVIDLALGGYEDIKGMLFITVDESDQIGFALNLENDGTTTHSFEINFPDLSGLNLGPASENLYYAYPQETFITGNKAINITKPYSGSFPMQFMDIFNPEYGWGFYLLVKDLDLIRKDFRLVKSGNQADLSVRYPTLDSTGFPPGSKMEIAPFALTFHPGDWHEAMKKYREWRDSWYQPQSPRQDWFQDVYSCRRDYPVIGTWYLYNRHLDEYTMQKEIDNAEKYLGGADMIDISSWGASSAYGRCGDYRRYEYGGLENFSSEIEVATNHNIGVGLYIEGYILDERSTVYGEHGDEWHMIEANGDIKRSGGGSEVFICPYPSGWQAHMKDLYAAVVDETGASAMYIDVYGTGNFRCYSDSHGHAPGATSLRGEYEMTRGIRDGLNSVKPGIPLYTEYTPVDFISQFQDGSFSYTVWKGNADVSPTMTNLFRFAFPDFKQIEIVNGMFLAKNWTEEGLKKAFFNGEGIWIKGDIPAWYDENTIRFYIQSHEIYRDHRDAFRDDNPEPLVPTLKGSLYANRFKGNEKKIVTFYNANFRDINGELFKIGTVTDVHVVDLWKEEMLESGVSSESFNIKADIDPRDIGCVGIFPRKMDATLQQFDLTIDILDPEEGNTLELVGIYPEKRIKIRLDYLQNQTLDLRESFETMPEKIIVKLRKDDIVTDEIILTNLPRPQKSLWLMF